MEDTIHSNARTKPQLQRELQEGPSSVSGPKPALRYGITRMTVRKWRYREDVEERTPRRETLPTMLTPEQESIINPVWEVTLLALDDLLIVAREFLISDLKPAAQDRCLRLHGVGNLRALYRL